MHATNDFIAPVSYCTPTHSNAALGTNNYLELNCDQIIWKLQGIQIRQLVNSNRNAFDPIMTKIDTGSLLQFEKRRWPLFEAIIIEGNITEKLIREQFR